MDGSKMSDTLTEKLDALRPLIGYFEVLIDNYPHPISHTELAKKSSVTKSAISKIRNRILALCNLEEMALNKKFLLKSDGETFWKLLLLFATDIKLNLFLRSNYARTVIEEFDIHNKLTEAFKDLSYEKYFTKEDTNWMIEIILYNVCSVSFPRDLKVYVNELSKREEPLGLVLPLIYVFNELQSGFNVAIFENKVEYVRTIELRNKFYRFILDNAENVLMKWDFIKNKESDEQQVYLKVYYETVKHFLASVLAKFTNKIQQKAMDLGLESEVREDKEAYALDA